MTKIFSSGSIDEGTFHILLITGFGLNYICINLSIQSKSKVIQDEKLRLEITRHDDLSRQRELISSDLHDDAGASLSSLYIYAGMAEKTANLDAATTRKHLERISIGLKELMENMNDIVWSISRDEPNEKSFSSRIKDYAYESMDTAGIEMRYQVDTDLEKSITSIQARRNLLLIAKEALNNILKHSAASIASLSLTQLNEQLVLEIKDNGQGFDTSCVKRGHGLSNMQRRAERLGGKLIITSQEGRGTQLHCQIPIAKISD